MVATIREMDNSSSYDLAFEVEVIKYFGSIAIRVPESRCTQNTLLTLRLDSHRVSWNMAPLILAFVLHLNAAEPFAIFHLVEIS